ncbi:MAG: DUF4395 domain-containing protein [Promicromonosporaceae bacterium]|nr:DUF4395 domain-containing protein [Promicromonosporaceae bacterium]
MTSPTPVSTQRPAGIDPRGPRVVAAITAVLLAVVVVLGVGESTRTAALVLLVVLAVSFAVGAVLGVQRTWQSWVFRTFVRPRLGAPDELEDPRPPRFAQLVGLVVTGVGVILGLAGVHLGVPIAAGLAFVAAALNAVVGLCLGCELYLLGRRLRAGA